MRKIYIQTIFTALFLGTMPFASSAQDINSTVEVRKAYEGKLREVHKPNMWVDVPDTVNRFNLEFEYDRFTSRYTSSYEFRPHLLDLKPNAQIDNGNTFFMKLGAGYTLNPIFDLVWSPRLKNNWKLNVYASHNSYVGNYFHLEPIQYSSKSIVLNKHKNHADQVLKYFGYDLLSKAGIDSRYDWNNSVFMFDLGYYGLAQKDWMKNRSYNALDAAIRIKSKSVKPNRFHYDFGIDYRFAADDVCYTKTYTQLQEHDFSVNALIGPVLKEKHKILFDLGFDGAFYRGALDSFVGNAFISAKYVYEKGRLDIAAGVRAEKLIRNSDIKGLHSSKEQFVYPDVDISFTAIKNGMDIYLKAIGGNNINTYSSILSKRHFADFKYGQGIYPAFSNDVERVAASIGVKGRITPYFSYDLSTGYRNMANGIMDAMVIGADSYLPALAYTSWQGAYVALDMRLKFDSFSAAFAMNYDYTDFLGKSEGIFEPAKFTGAGSLTWNWHKRVWIGADCEFATERYASISDTKYMINGYTDLGLYIEYRHTSHLSFWLRGGNLLFHTIQRNPFHAEKGGNFTVGICLNM